MYCVGGNKAITVQDAIMILCASFDAIAIASGMQTVELVLLSIWIVC